MIVLIQKFSGALGKGAAGCLGGAVAGLVAGIVASFAWSAVTLTLMAYRFGPSLGQMPHLDAGWALAGALLGGLWGAARGIAEGLGGGRGHGC